MDRKTMALLASGMFLGVVGLLVFMEIDLRLATRHMVQTVEDYVQFMDGETEE